MAAAQQDILREVLGLLQNFPHYEVGIRPENSGHFGKVVRSARVEANSFTVDTDAGALSIEFDEVQILPEPGAGVISFSKNGRSVLLLSVTRFSSSSKEATYTKLVREALKRLG
ncbi:MAG TPA: hypothetical protein VJ841_01760 [Candidatus Saccharimonadales bacterium]|nr:hypothetical protein [Candidatus Saccharimonadales bacterium]